MRRISESEVPVRFFFLRLCFVAAAQRQHSNVWALFSSNFFFKTGTVALSFVCDKYCPIMD